LPINRAQQAQKLRKINNRLEQERGGSVHEEELAKELDITVNKLNEINAVLRPLLSLDESVHDDDSQPLQEILADPEDTTPEDNFVQEELHAQLLHAMEKLTDRERDIVTRYYGLGDEESTSLEAIGEDINLSRERVRQIRNDALRKMKQAVSGAGLADYLS
jgi:RNA polymerase primary sigma factor